VCPKQINKCPVKRQEQRKLDQGYDWDLATYGQNKGSVIAKLLFQKAYFNYWFHMALVTDEA